MVDLLQVECEGIEGARDKQCKKAFRKVYGSVPQSSWSQQKWTALHKIS